MLGSDGDATIQQPLQKLPIAIGRIGCDGGGLSSLPLHKAGEHVLCGRRLLTHVGCSGLDSHDHATIVVHQIVVVVPEPGRCTALRGNR